MKKILIIIGIITIVMCGGIFIVYGFSNICPYGYYQEEDLCVKKITERATCPENWNMHARSLTCTSGTEEMEVICDPGYEINYDILGLSSPNCWNCCYRMEATDSVTRFNNWFN